MSHRPPDPKLLSINTATVRKRWNLGEIFEGCARHGIQGVSPWRDQVQTFGLTESAKMVRDLGFVVTGYCRGGMFPGSTPEEIVAARDDNRRAVDEACELGATCLVLVVGGLPKGSKDILGARAQVRDGIGELLDYARPRNMPLAIEPLHPMYAADRACVNTTAHANDLCDELGDDGLGIALDVYHVWWDPYIHREINRAGKKRILAFHICDWLVPTRDLLLDRGMMGDGVIDIPSLRAAVEGQGYEGFHEVEIFSGQDWWERPPDEVLKTCIERHQSCC
ncbi:sugar phosphate isomerase/epimerase family protein [Paludisphaera rhizosphaerae]|uniref:sugar phosphate isomerase/epimerase family protein n=1 Tax=Paludisphaera rhizosphaerae TaxID=2711216 RepID=UPI0013ED3E7B|nr:sugar phosphate isomerase/epimerase family protein [Paludisphaera rhizosphaerae]